MLLDIVIASLLNTTACAVPVRRQGRLVIVSAGQSETPIPISPTLLELSQPPTQATLSSTRVRQEGQAAHVSSSMRREFRAAVRRDLLGLLAEISEMPELEVSDELQRLAEAVCGTTSEVQSPEEIRAWAEQLSHGIVSD